VTYEEMSSDFSQVTFSSARMGRIAHYQNVYNWRWHMMIPLLCDGVMRWWMEWAMLAGKIDRISRATWTAPNMPTIEPDKEGLGIQRMVRNGGQTLFEMIRERGNDPRSVLAEIAAGNAELDRLGIWLDCDPRRTSGAGLTQQRAGVGQPGDAGGEADPDVIEHGLPTDETASA
jgi:capsid protein